MSSPDILRQFSLRTGDTIEGVIAGAARRTSSISA